MSGAPDYASEPDWVRPVFDFADAALQAHPPAFPPTVERQEALMALDGPLHLEAANRFRSTHEFLLTRVSRAVDEIAAHQDDPGARIWRIYNHGFVVRAGGRTVAFDLVRGWQLRDGSEGRYGLPDGLVRRLASELDVMFISHAHTDHVDPGLCEILFEQGVPVIAGPEILADVTGQPLLLRHEPAEDPHTPRDLVSSALRRPLRYVPYPGHQGRDTPCAVNLAFLPGASIMHSGDLSGGIDWHWLDRIHERHAVDALLINCWTTNMPRVIAGVRPRIAVTGHETEMAHGPNHREAYWRSFQIFRGRSEPPTYTLCWGESATVPPQEAHP